MCPIRKVFESCVITFEPEKVYDIIRSQLDLSKKTSQLILNVLITKKYDQNIRK